MRTLGRDDGLVRRRKHLRRLSVMCAIGGVLIACFSNLRRSLPGGYYLEGWQGGDHYTLGGPTHSADAGGVLAGSVERIGWNEAYIVAWRTPMVARDAAGWMVVDIRSHVVRGPMGDAELASDPQVRGIATKPPSEYWAE
jgi:hypothetical protein